MRIRSVELEMPNAAAAATFLQNPWGLIDTGKRGDTTYLRATSDQAYAISVKEAAQNAMISVTFTGSTAEVKAVYARVQKSGLKHGPWIEEFDEPGRGAGFYVTGTEGEPYRFLAEKDPTAALPADNTRPLHVSHIVFNTLDRESGSKVLTDVFGFKMSDRTRIMNFLRPDNIHHAVAYADAKNVSLNHIAFEMQDTDAVMRGMGRLKDAGCASVWGPGRHGPGNNVFSYFVTPFGATIEYTAEVQRVDANYRTGRPEDWTWPPRRNDHWGIAVRDNARLHDAEKTFGFKAAA